MNDQNIGLKIPHPRITTYNVTSLSAYAKRGNDPTGQRFTKIIITLSILIASCDILCLQETKLNEKDQISLKAQFPNQEIYYNNFNRSKAGTVIIINKTVLKNYSVKEITPPNGAIGYTQLIRLVPKANDSLSYNVINTYIDPPKISEITGWLLDQDNGGHTFWCGDFNFSETPLDAPSPLSKSRLDKAGMDLWGKLKIHFSLTEIYQPDHTQHFITNSKTGCRSSKVDRIYASYSEAEKEILNPKTFIPKTPFDVTKRWEPGPLPSKSPPASGTHPYNQNPQGNQPPPFPPAVASVSEVMSPPPSRQRESQVGLQSPTSVVELLPPPQVEEK